MDSQVIFDDIQSGIERLSKMKDGQISIKEYLEEIKDADTLPSLSNVKIDIAGIRVNTSEEHKERGIGVINVATPKVPDGIISSIANKAKRELEVKNNELLKIKKHPYIPRDGLLTQAEKKFYKLLKNKLHPKCTIFVKVRLADVVEMNKAVSRDSIEFRKIAMKHVDYILVDENLDIICAVELDDYTHDTPETKARDKFVDEVLTMCGIKIFRIRTAVNSITNAELRPIENWVLDRFAPVCKLCGSPMILSENRSTGHRFYGCLKYYEKGPGRCLFTINIDPI